MNYANKASRDLFIEPGLRDGWRNYLNIASNIEIEISRRIAEIRAAEVLFERECLPGNTATGGEAGEVTPTISSGGAGTSRTGNERTEAQFLVQPVSGPLDLSGPGASRAGDSRGQDTVVPVVFQQNTRDEVRLMQGDGQIAGALSAEPGAKQQNYVAFDWQSGGDVRLNVSDKPMLQANQVPAVASFDGAQITSKANRSKAEPGEPAPSLNGEGRISIFMAGQGSKAGGVGASETISPTLKGSASGLNQVPSIALSLTASPTASGRLDPSGETFIAGPMITVNTANAGANQNNAKITDTLDTLDTLASTAVLLDGVRRLTPVECEKLQGFPPNWTLYGLDENGKKIEQSDSARYKQCGNAVAVPCVEWIARRIKQVHDNQ